MGLPMDNLHSPTVASGPTSSTAANGSAQQLSLMELIAEKDRVESELSALGSVLDSVCIPPRQPVPRGDDETDGLRSTA